MIPSVPRAGTLPEFLMQLAGRLNPTKLSSSSELPDLNKDTTWPPLYDSAAAVAVGLAIDHPAEAERALNLWKRSGIQILTNHYVMQLCYRLARVDPTCARRVAMGGVMRNAALASGLPGAGPGPEKEKTGAAEAVDHAIEEIDRLRESGPGPEPIPRIGGVLSMYPTNPAALILPVVERAVPDRLDDVFWRTGDPSSARGGPGARPSALLPRFRVGDIMLGNAHDLLPLIAALEAKVRAIRLAIGQSDGAELERLLTEGQSARLRLVEP